LKKYNRIFICLLLVLAVYSTIHFLVPERLKTRPAITLKIIDGSTIELSSINDKPLLINFWATTCSICMQELPEMIALYKNIAPEDLQIVAIAMPYDPPNLVLGVVKQFNIPYPVALDINGKAMEAFGDVTSTPTSYLIAPDGKVVMQNTGRTDFRHLKQHIERLQTDTGNKS